MNIRACWTVVLLLALLCTGCAVAQPPVTAAVGSSSSSSPVDPTADSSPSTQVPIDGSCPSNEPFVDSLNSVAAGATTVIGVAKATGQHVAAKPDSFATETTVIYAEVSVDVQQELLGPKLPSRLTVYLPGGSMDGTRTTVTSILESAWATDGKFFGTVYPSAAFPGEYTMEVLPLIQSNITFSGVGCRQPIGLPVVGKNTQQVLAMDDGDIVTRSGQFPTIELAAVEKLLG